MHLQITYRHMPHSAVLDEQIGEQARKLEEIHPRITSCHVIVDELDRNKEQGNLFEVHVDVKAPRAEVVATRQRHEDPYVAMKDAFDAVFRQVNEILDKQRGEVKTHQRERGDNAAP